MNNFFTADLRLVKAKENIDLVKSDQPLFFQYWKDQVDFFEEPTIFLNEKYVGTGRSPSKHTWAAAGYDLLSWFQWCQARKIDWRDATESDREQFCDDYKSSCSSTGTPYDAKTINRKLSIVRRFYLFASAERWYQRDIGTSIEHQKVANRPIDDDALAHTRSTSIRFRERDPLLLKVGRKDVFRPLQANQLKKLIEHVGPIIHEVGDARSVRDRLICDLGWISGARLEDVTKLTTIQFLSFIIEPHQMHQDFSLIVVGKMSVTRRMAVPGWLIVAIQSYIQGERVVSEREGRKRGTKHTTALFLGHPSSKSAGKPITNSAIQKMVALACTQCGITELKEVHDEDTGKNHIKTVPAHSFHDLRHNCAVLTYHSERALGNSDPWKIVQIKLGHMSLKVTMDTYLAHVSIFGEKQGITDIRSLLGIKT